MTLEKIIFAEKLAKFQDQWAPKIIAQMNEVHFKLARLAGSFIWHSHPETDEVFIVLEGVLEIQLRDGSLQIQAGEMCVVPRGVEHRPVAEKECAVLLVEPAGTINTGDAGGERTAAHNDWI